MEKKKKILRERNGYIFQTLLPEMSYGFGSDQREDDIIVLLTLEPVDSRHL